MRISLKLVIDIIFSGKYIETEIFMYQNERGEAYIFGAWSTPGRVDDFAVPSASCFGIFGLVIDRVHFRAKAPMQQILSVLLEFGR